MKKRTQPFASIILLLVLSATGWLSAKDAKTVDPGSFTINDKAYYISQQDKAFIRPGLELVIMDVIIPPDLQPEVWFTLSDPAGLPLDIDGITTPGPVSTSFIMSFIPAEEQAYVSYTTRVQTSPITGDSAEQASTDSGGTYTTIATGEYMYKFATELPADYDGDVTHTLGIYASRDLREFDLDRYVDNQLFHFVPSGSSEPEPRSIVTTETCNGRCHDPLALHGGSRQEVGLCVMCHNPSQGIDPDTGNTVNFPTMIHKIHAGAELANGYTIVGYRQTAHDYSHVEFPSEINDCETCHTGGTPTENFPMVADPPVVQSCDRKGKGATTFRWSHTNPVQIRVGSPDGRGIGGGGPEGEVTTGSWIKDGMIFFLFDKVTGEPVQELVMNTSVLGCVAATPGSTRGMPGQDHTAWLERPSREVCGSCHDDVNFATGENHSLAQIEQEDDALCGLCHEPYSGKEYDRSIRGAHTVDYKSAQLGGVLVQVEKVAFTGPGQFPRVTFWLSDKNGMLNPAKLGRLRFAIAGPNTDFDYYLQEDALGALVPKGKMWQYTFSTPMPDDAMGSYSLGVEGRINGVVLNPGTNSEFSMNDQMQNFSFPFAVTDEQTVARRMIVDDAKCESCHGNLSLHGENRHDPQYCVTCHQPGATDEAVRTADSLPAESIHFKYMIHKIHRGAELENGYTVFGYRSSVHDFSEIEFTGDLRNCDKCHVNNSQQLPLPGGLLSTFTNYDFLNPTAPAAAACLSCHDGLSASAHAQVNTGPIGESCATCHGEGKEFSVDRVHAR